jgi:NAD(P)H dehydrogenase (quinone)
MTIAITGATGQLGRLAIAAVKARGAAPIALARDPAKAADLNVETRAFDYATADPDALKGVETLVLISSNDLSDRVSQHKRAIAAAKAAGVTRIVYTSLLKGAANQMQLSLDHAPTEAALIESSIAYTILRNGWYTENYTGALDAVVAHGAMIGAAGEGQVSSAARKDYAEAIAVVALDDGHARQVYELAGDAAHSGADLAAAVASATGKPVAYVNLPEAGYAAALEGFGLPPILARALADSETWASKGALYDDSRTLSRLIGRPTTPIAQTIAAAL